MGKVVKSFRLSEKSAKQLEAMAKRWQLGQTDVIALLIHAAEEIGWADEEKFDEMLELLRRV